jgi:hypothetical protein
LEFFSFGLESGEDFGSSDEKQNVAGGIRGLSRYPGDGRGDKYKKPTAFERVLRK